MCAPNSFFPKPKFLKTSRLNSWRISDGFNEEFLLEFQENSRRDSCKNPYGIYAEFLTELLENSCGISVEFLMELLKNF